MAPRVFPDKQRSTMKEGLEDKLPRTHAETVAARRDGRMNCQCSGLFQCGPSSLCCCYPSTCLAAAHLQKNCEKLQTIGLVLAGTYPSPDRGRGFQVHSAKRGPCHPFYSHGIAWLRRFGQCWFGIPSPLDSTGLVLSNCQYWQ